MTEPLVSDTDQPTSGDTPPVIKWWVEQDGNPDGPYTAAYIAAMLTNGRLRPTTSVCRVGSQRWQTIVSCHELVQLIEAQSPGCIPPSLPASPGLAMKVGRFVRRLTNPALPWFVNLICLYCLLVVPAWVFLGLLSTIGGGGSAADLKVDSSLIGCAIAYDVISLVVEIVLASILVYGGYLTLCLHRKGVTLIKWAIVLRLCYFVLELFALVLWSAIVAATDQAIPVDESISTSEVLVLIVSLIVLLLLLASIAFEVVAFVWLLVNDRRLSEAQTELSTE
jgi:hypothetical protein